jgi:quercetin dioxygenase-like cupin family protein
MEPRIMRADEGRRVSLFEVAFRYGLESGHTDGALAILEVVSPPRTLVKPHRHSNEDEFTLVLEGTVGVRLGELESEVSAGSYLVKPRNVAHAMWNIGDVAARIAEIVVPGGLEEYFEQLGPILQRDDEAADADYDALASRYGIVIENDWVTELEARYGVRL